MIAKWLYLESYDEIQDAERMGMGTLKVRNYRTKELIFNPENVECLFRITDPELDSEGIAIQISGVRHDVLFDQEIWDYFIGKWDNE